MASLTLYYVDGSSDTAETKDLPGLRRLLANILRSSSCTAGLQRYELRDGGAVIESATLNGPPALTPIARAVGRLQ